MPNQFLPKCAPIWGFPPHFSVADLSTNDAASTWVMQTSVDAISNAINLYARGVELICVFGDNSYTCDLDLLTSVSGVDTVVHTFPGLNALVSQDMYAGNLEFIDLQGVPLKLQSRNTVNPNGVQAIFSLRPVY